MIKEKEIQGTEEIFDEELKKLLGSHYHNQPLTLAQPDEEEYEQVQEVGSGFGWGRVKAPVMLALADGLMFFMCMGGKIDLPYGLAFLACISAAFGHSLRKAGAYEA